MTFDVRCSITLRPFSDTSRCQLYVGHEGDHALLTIESGQRTLRQWHNTSITDASFGTQVHVQLLWAPSFPSLTSTESIAVLQLAGEG
jgi:hypothetical protein